ncbi:MAG: polysaccharide deacetylase family protein [Methylobacter sp.]|nr:polysaccharide deacetylase family protein [Methylobacter sp.]
MSLHHHILAATYYPIKLAKAIGRPLGLIHENQLRVLLYHDIDPRDQANFAAQMRWLQRSWNFVSAEQFADMVSGHEPIRGRNLLLAFDDGFASNRVVAEEVLNPMGIKALFFVMSYFVDLEDVDEVRHFIAKNIYPGTHAAGLPAHWRTMGWADLEALLQQGHSIGGHTRTHARLSQIKNEPDLEREIIASADALEQRLGVPIEHFAYTFGDLASFSDQALAVARRRFRFIYSGLRGDNVGGVSPYALRRDSAAFQDAFSNYSVFSNSLLGAFLEGAADFKYADDIARLSSWARQI